MAGSLAIQGPPTTWVADHRRHHAFTDRDGDPHSPWRYGTSVRALAKGLLYAHCGWFLTEEVTNKARFASNFWPPAILSFGESWHNFHHADPTGARHGVLRGQIDPAARLIWLFGKAGWMRDVRWPQPDRLAAKRSSD